MSEIQASVAGQNVLLSVYSKEGIVDFAQGLVALGKTIYSSGGTARHLREAGIPVIDTAEYIGNAIASQIDRIAAAQDVAIPTKLLGAIRVAFGESSFGHRVATLYPQIHGGLLCRDTVDTDIEDLETMCGVKFDIVCVDFYALAQEIAKPDATFDSIIEMIDIGGPTMVKSAAKGGRIVVCDPADRQPVLDKLRANGNLTIEERRELAAKAFFTVVKYYLPAARYLSDGKYDGFLGQQVATCKYGENGHMHPAGLFSTSTDDPFALERFSLVAGDALSYINYTDLDRLLQTMTHIGSTFLLNGEGLPSTAIGVKHGNPCGAASINDDTPTALLQVLEQMVTGDPRAIFGGFVMTNFPIGVAEAEVLLHFGIGESTPRRLLDGIIAPSFSTEAIDLLKRKKAKCRFLANPELGERSAILDRATRFRYARGGFLRQPNYTNIVELAHPALAWLGQITPVQRRDMLLGIAICHTSNSNTITLVHNGQLIGNGVGRQDRVGAAELAIKIARDAGHETEDAVAISDSYFPATDGPQRLIDAGVKVIFTTNGSIHDGEVEQAIRGAGVTLIWGPDSEFRGFYGH